MATEADRPSGWLRALVVVLAIGASLGAGLAGGYRHALRPVESTGREQAPAIFEVGPGESLSDVARELESRGLIRSARAMRLHARLAALATKLKVGEYELAPGLSTPQITGILASVASGPTPS